MTYKETVSTFKMAKEAKALREMGITDRVATKNN